MADSQRDKFFERRKRLVYAKNVWMKKGLIGTRDASVMRMLIEFYRGNQWAHLLGMFGDLEAEDYATVNKVFPVANTLMGEVAARNPHFDVMPRTEESIAGARPVEHLINYDVEELKFKRQLNKALLHHMFAPFGIIRHGFTPSEEWETDSGRRMELYRPAKPDRPYLRAIPIWNVLADPTRDSFHTDEGMGWCAFRDIMRLKDIQDNPNMIARDELKNLTGNISPEWEAMRPDYFDPADDPDRDTYLEVYTVYEARERIWYQMTLDGLDKYLRKPGDWPIPWETLPLSVFSVNEQMDTPFPLPILDAVAPIQTELNRLRTMMGQLVFRLRRILGYNKAGIDPAEVAKIEDGALNEMVGFNGMPSEMLQMITSGVFPQELLQYNALLEEDIREVSGQSKMGRAQRINVETAHEVERVQQGQDISTGRIVDAFEDFSENVVRLYMQGRRATMDITGPEIVRIVGQQDADGAQQWATVDPEMLHGEYDFRVVAGSTRPRDRMTEVRMAAADFEIANQHPDLFNVAFFARRFLEARGIEPTRGMTKQALTASAVRMLDAIRRQAQMGEESPAGGTMSPDVASLMGAAGGGGGGLPQ